MDRDLLDRQGFVLVRGLFPANSVALAALDDLPAVRGGIRFPEVDHPVLNEWIDDPGLAEVIRGVVGGSARRVRSILFDKTPDANWPVLWHQDKTITVEDQREVDGFGPWSQKVGQPHVQPPASVLEGMLTARIHLDDCDSGNGALQVLPGSHREGVLSPEEVRSRVDSGTPFSCEAQAGDVLFMRPLVLHASGKSTRDTHRRILHLEYARPDLPGGLRFGCVRR